MPDNEVTFSQTKDLAEELMLIFAETSRNLLMALIYNVVIGLLSSLIIRL